MIGFIIIMIFTAFKERKYLQNMRNFFNSTVKYFKSNPDATGPDGRTRLQYAVAGNDLKKVNALIAAKANLNASTPQSFPPLHAAIRNNNHLIALALLAAGAGLDYQDVNGQTPLHHAVEKNDEALILTLLKLGANPNIQDKQGKAPLHLASTQKPEVIQLLARYKAHMNVRDKEGDTPLHRFLNHPKMVECLMNNGADPNVRNHRGMSPYMMMLDDSQLRKYPETLQRMVFFKADLASANGLGETILHLAARLELEETFVTVVKSTELTLKDRGGNSVLHLLARAQNVPMIARVLERAPGLVHETNGRGLTPMAELVQSALKTGEKLGKKYIATANILLSARADPDSQDESGFGLLHHAVDKNETAFMENLLLKKANPNLADKKRKTPLHYAIEKKNVIAVDILLDNGADPDRTDERGWTILDYLAKAGDRDSPIVQRLIVAGGQYKKQLPLYPELMRRPPKITDKKSYGGYPGGPGA